jgi:hypothetical protein
MSKRARDLSSHLGVFNNRLITFLKGLDEARQARLLSWEGYSVLVVAGHISGPRHYGLRDMARKFIDGDSYSDITKDMVVQMANQDFELRKKWTLTEVIGNLEEQGQLTSAYISSLSDENLKVIGHLESYGGDITVDQLINWIIIGTSVDHLENMKRAAL